MANLSSSFLRYSDEDTDSDCLKKLYCDAITGLAPKIVAVLRNETSILSKAHAVGLIGEDLYSTGITLQDSSKQIEQLLLMVKSQIKVQVHSYSNFLDILKSAAATEHIAAMIEKKVEQLRQQSPKKVRKRKGVRSRQGKGKGKSWGLPTLDGYSSGFLSDFSTNQAGDAVTQPKLSRSLSSGAKPTGSASYIIENPPNEQDNADSAEVVAMAPHQDTGSPSSYVPLFPNKSVEENRPIQNGEKTHLGTEESAHFERSLSSVPVYPSHKYVANIFEDIHDEVESGMTKVENVIAGNQRAIHTLLEKLEGMKLENQKLKEKIEKKEKDYNELDSLMKSYEKDVEELKEQHQCDQEKIEQLEQKLANIQNEMKRKEEELLADIEQKSEDIEALKQAREIEDQLRESVGRELDSERQKAENLGLDLQKAMNEKIALEKQKSEADLRLSELRLKCKEDIADITEKMHNLKLNSLQAKMEAKMEAELKLQEERALREKAEIKARTEVEQAKMQAQNEVEQAKMQARNEVEQAKILAQNAIEKAQMQAQMQIHKAESDTQLQLALQNQAQGFVRMVSEAQRSITSSSSGSVTQEEWLSIQMQTSVTLENSSTQQTPSDDCEKPTFNSEPWPIC